MSQAGRSSEQEFNLAFGESLRSTNYRWRDVSADSGLESGAQLRPRNVISVEQTGVLAGPGNQAKKPDILIIDENTPPVVIECSYQGPDADRDAKSRLGLVTSYGQLRIKTAIAVEIPPRYRDMSLNQMIDALGRENSIRYALHHENDYRWPKRGFLSGPVSAVSSLIVAAALPKEELERVAEEVAGLVDAAADRLELYLSGQHIDEIREAVLQRTHLKGLRTTALLWLNALLTQQRLSSQRNSGIPAVDFSDESSVLPSDQLAIWVRIVNENWRSIFEPAVGVLRKVSRANPSATNEVFSLLTEAVEKIETARLGPRMNVGAELFPKLSDDRKQAAAFYTKPATAELLAALTIRFEDLDTEEWKSGDIFENHALADLSCGTGTLLRAGYRRILEFHEAEGKSSESSSRRLHRCAMELGLVGTDISPIAAHLTASSLAAIGYGDPYGNTNIGWLRVGGGSGLTGALEFFGTEAAHNMFEDVAGRSTGTSVQTQEIVVSDNSLKWILMNPPYTRTKGGQGAFDVAGLNEAERRACQNRWGKLTKNEPINKHAGMGASFLALARKKIQPGGRIGFVLPLTAAFADSWAQTRKMIELEFTDVVIVAVASGATSMSADTGLEEMLLVARKRTEDEYNLAPPFQLHCVTLRRPFDRLGEAGEVARSILAILHGNPSGSRVRAIIAGDDELGSVVSFDNFGNGAPWSPLGVVHGDLALATEQLTGGVLGYFSSTSMPLGVEMTTVGQEFTVGPTHHLIGHPSGKDPIGVFEIHPVIDSLDTFGVDRMLWAAQSESQKKLLVEPTHKGEAIDNAQPNDLIERMRSKSSTLFYARNMRWTSQALVAATTSKPVMGGRAWTALLHEDQRICRAFALWVNSTLGMILHWKLGQRTQVGRSTLQVGAIKQVPCPRLSDLGGTSLEIATSEYERLSSEFLMPACLAHKDDVRKQIDQAVIKMLNLPKESEREVELMRTLWCNEPTVHGWNKTAVDLLSQEDQTIM